MPWRIAQRVGQAAVVLLLAYTAAFLLLAALPGDAVMARYGSPELALSPEQISAISATYGYDRPLWERYFESLWAFLRGDFGYSVHSGAQVSALLAEAIPSSLTLAGVALIGAVVLAFIITWVASTASGAWVRASFSLLPPALASLPVFWVGIMLIQIVSFQLGWIPVIGATPMQALILPVLTLMVPISAPIAQVLIRTIDEVRKQPYVTVTRARGARESWLFWKTVIPNALIPVLTLAAVLFGELIGGAIVTEAVFGRTGIGSLAVGAVTNRDTPVLLAVVVIAAVVFVTVNLIVDLVSPAIDPRLRGHTRRAKRGAHA